NKSMDMRRLAFRLFQLSWSEKDGAAGEVGRPVPVAPPEGQIGVPVNAAAPDTRSKAWLWAALGVAVFVLMAAVVILAAPIYARRRGVAPVERPDDEDEPEPAASLNSFECPECGKDLKTKPGTAGRKVRCPKCGKSIVVPGSVKSS